MFSPFLPQPFSSNRPQGKRSERSGQTNSEKQQTSNDDTTFYQNQRPTRLELSAEEKAFN